jgi:hypothetical protein
VMATALQPRGLLPVEQAVLRTLMTGEWEV